MTRPLNPTAVPWPSLLVGRDGGVQTSAATVQLLGFTPRRVEDLEQRLAVASAAGAPPDHALPWRRAFAGTPFEDDELWRDRLTGAELALRVRCRELGGDQALLELEPRSDPAERRVHHQLAALNEAILTRESGREPVSLRDVLLKLVVLACEMTGARYGALGVLSRDRG